MTAAGNGSGQAATGPSGSGPVLIGCAHGTGEPAGQRVTLDLLDAIRDRLNVEVREAYVDVQDPKVDVVVDEVLGTARVAGAGSGADAVVVPLLLASGYHVYVDIAQAVKGRAGVVAARALGPDERLIDVVLDRVAEAHIPAGATLVLAAAGSSDSRSLADTAAAAAMLRERWGGDVRIGYAAGIKPTVREVVDAAREADPEAPVAVASFLLFPGFFQKRIEAAGADHCTGPLAPHPLLVDIVADRYREASGA